MTITVWVVSYKLYCKLYRKYKKVPPGPNGIPLLGSLPWAIINSDRARTYLPNNYNRYITYWWIGAEPVVSIHNAKIAKQIFGNPNCQDRSPTFNAMIANEPDVLRVKYGKNWKERRKLIRSTLLTMEDSNYVDINVRMFTQKYIEPKIESSMKSNGYINAEEILLSIRHLAFSMVLKVMFGIELTNKDPLFQKLAKLYEDWSIDIVTGNMWNLSPILSIINGKRHIKHVRNLENKLDQLIKEKFFDPQIQKNKENVNKKKQTYFDHAYNYINDETLNKNNITLKQLLMDFRILIQASIDTASFVLQMGLLNLIKYPEIQNIIHEELNGVFVNGTFELKQVVKCPKFRAYVNEILRIALPVPAGVPRYATKDIDVRYEDEKSGETQHYVIPKGTTVALNLAYIHFKDKEKWGKDEAEICLDNWLEYDGDKVIFKNRKDVFPFSVGSRDCVGRSLAMRLLYSVFATIILKYELDKYDDNFEIKTKLTRAGAHRVETRCNIMFNTRNQLP